MTLFDLKAGDKVAHYCGWGSPTPKKAIVKRTTTDYVIIEIEADHHERFRKEDGCVIDCVRGKTDRINIPTPEVEAQWGRENLIENFIELMNDRDNYNAVAFRKAVHQLVADYLDQDDYIKVMTVLIRCESIPSETLENTVNELWDKIC